MTTTEPELVVGAALVIRLCGPPSTLPAFGPVGWAADGGVRAFRDLYPYALAAEYQLAPKIGDIEKGVMPAN